MNNIRTYLIVLFTLMLASLACGVTNFVDRSIEGSGNMITENRDVRGFDRVNLAGFGEVTIEVGDEESLTVTTDDNIMPYVRTEVKNNTLVLDFDEKGFVRNYNSTDGIKFKVVVKELSRVSISGAGSMTINELETENLQVDLSGAGTLKVNSLTADELVIHQSGAGTVVVSGKVIGQELSHSGLGSFFAADLESETAIVEISGAGSATLWATESLDVDISGLGHVVYYGNPRILQRISGLGNLISAEK